MSNSFKRKLSAFVSMLALVSISSAAMAADVNAGTFTAGNVLGKTNNAEVAIKNNRMDINVIGKRGAVAQVDFRNFNVKKAQQVNYGFSNTSQTMINRVLGGTRSTINGKITTSSIGGGDYANSGKVILINPAGVMFGAGSTVDLNSLTVSTFDFKGAKNLKGMTDAQLKAYQNNVLNKLSPSVATNGVKSESKEIVFDSNYTSELDKGLKGEGVKNGIKDYAGKTKITLNGTHFDKFTDQTNSKVADYNSNKSVAFVADNIDYKDSIIRVGDHYNYTYKDAGGNTSEKAHGNVRLVTADGVTFSYTNSGSTVAYDIQRGTKNINRNININNSGLNGKTAIDAEDIRIRTASSTDNAGSSIKIKDTVIKGRKLLSNNLRNIQIISDAGNVELDNTRIDTVNTTYSKTKENTRDLDGGRVYIAAKHDLKINDSVIKTAGSSQKSTVENGNEVRETAGNVDLRSYHGNADIQNTKVISSGDVTVYGEKSNNINNSMLRAKNNVGTNPENKNVSISSNNKVNIKDSIAEATGDIDIYSADSNGNTKGTVNITSTQKDGANQTLLKAGNNLSIEGRSTTLDNVSARYQTIKFYNDNTKGTNDVTVKNNSTFTQYNAAGTKTGNISLTTNGNFTLDKATMKTGNDTYSITADDNTATAYKFTVKGATNTANNISVGSTAGNVNVINGSDVNVKNNIRFTSSKGNYTQDDSNIEAGNNINVTANKDVTIKNKSDNKVHEGSSISIGGDNTAVNADNDVTIISQNGNYIQDDANVTAANNVNITAKYNVNISDDKKKDGYMYAYPAVDEAVKAGNNVNITSQAGDYAQDDALIYAKNDVNIKAANNLNIKDDHDVKVVGRYHYSDTAIQAGKNINLTAQNGNYNQQTATISSGNDTNITATNGSVYIKADSQEHATGNLNIVSKNDINFGKESTDNIDSTSYFSSGNNMKFQSTAGSITGEKTDMETPHAVIANSPDEPNIRYGNRLEFNAKGDNVFTSQNSLKSVNVDYIAGGSNKFDTQGDIQFVNSSLQGQENIINSGDDVVLNNLTADNAKTQINAAGYVTTENVTGEDLSAKGGSFPQSVSVDLQPACDPAPEVDPIYSSEDSYSGQIGQISAQESAITEELAEEETVSTPGIVGVPVSEENPEIITIQGPSGEAKYSTITKEDISGVFVPKQEPTIKEVEDKLK